MAPVRVSVEKAPLNRPPPQPLPPLPPAPPAAAGLVVLHGGVADPECCREGLAGLVDEAGTGEATAQASAAVAAA